MILHDPFLETTPETGTALAGLHEQVEGGALRRFVLLCAVASWVMAMVWTVAPPELDALHRTLLVSDGVVVAIVLAAIAWASSRWPIGTQRTATSAAWALQMALVVAAFGLREGVLCGLLVGTSLVVCLLTVIAGWRRGASLAAVASVALVVMAALQFGGWLFAASAADLPYDESLAVALAGNLVFIGVGLAGGRFLSTVMRRALQAASDREQRFSGIVRMAVDWHWEQDDHFRHVAVHGRPGAVPALVDDDWVGHALWDLPEVRLDDDTLDAHRADLESRRPFADLVARIRDQHGRWRHASISGEPRYDADGIFLGYWGIGQDVTHRVSAKRATEASEQRYRQLFEYSPSPVLLHRRGHIVDANAAAARMFGHDGTESMVGRELATLYVEGASRDNLRDLVTQLERLPMGSALPVADFRMKARDGRSISVQATSVRVDGGNSSTLMTIYFDVTQRVTTEAALRRSEGMLSLLFAASPDCITLTEMETGRYRLVNDSFARLTGYRNDELIGRSGADLAIWDSPADLEALLLRLSAHGHVDALPAAFRAKDGRRISMLVSAARFTMGRRHYVVINARDVTEAERVRLEHAAIFDRASVGIALVRGARFLHVNPRFERVFGWPVGSLAGKSCAEIHLDGASHAAFEAAAQPLLDRGLPFQAERDMRRHDGSLFHCKLMAQVVDTAAPSGAGVIWIAEDVTSQRDTAVALEAARDAAEAGSRAKSAFLANTSHEIRTPLNGLLGMTRLALRDDIGEASRRRHLHQILDSAQSLSDIISDILDLSKIEAGKLALETVPFDLHAIFDGLHRTYLPLAEAKGLVLQLRIDDEVPRTVRGDPMRVRQIIGNFVSNALKFTDRGAIRLHAGLLPGGPLRIEVDDTGAGVDELVQKRLFAPFTQADDSTTRRYGGTGLGLSICRELAHMMGGEVGMHSSVGTGSTFWAVLPLPVSEPVPAAPGNGGASAVSVAGCRVLLVEDNPVNMLIATAMLEQWDVQVTQATDGRSAIDAVQRAADARLPFDLVLMDVQMPVMSGHQATRQLRLRHGPDTLPIVALTAAALVSEREEALASGMDDFLTKPIDAARLFETVARFHARRRSAVASIDGAPPGAGATARARPLP